MHSRTHAEKEYWPNLDRALRLYRGEHFEDQGKAAGYDRVVVNYLYPTVETKVAALALQYPEFFLVPLRADFEGQTPLVREVLQYTFKRGRHFAEAKRALRDKEIGGIGVTITGWLLVEQDERGETQTEYQGARPLVEDEPPDPTPNEGSGLSALGSGREGAMPTLPSWRVRESRPYAARICPRDFWVAPETGSVLDESMWCGYSERVPLEAVKNNRRYRNKGKIEGTTDSLVDLDVELRDKSENTPDDCKRVLLHHYYEKTRRVHVVFAEEEEKALLVEAWPQPFDRYPFNVLRVPDEEDRFFPTPPLLRLEHPQREINQARTLLALHQRQSNRKYQRVGKMSEANKRQFRSSTMLGLIELEDNNMITEVPHAPIQPEIFQSMEAAQQDIQVFSALNEYESFAPPSKRLTQTEVAAIQAAGGARASEARGEFERFLSEIARDTLAWMQQYSVATQQFPVFASSGQIKQFGHYTREEIQGEYLVDVYAGSTTAPNKKSFQETFAWMMQSLPNVVQAIMAGQQAGLNIKYLVEQFFRSVPEIRDVEKVFQPDPTAGPAMMAPGAAGGAPMLPGMDGSAGGQAVPPEADLLSQIDPGELEQFIQQMGSLTNGTSGVTG